VHSCSCGHDGSLSNAPPGRLQIYGLFNQQCQQHWPKTSGRERIFSRRGNQTYSDVRLGWFQHKGIAALMPKPTCSIWIGISLPNSFSLTGSSTSVSSGNGGEENCSSVNTFAHVESSPRSVLVTMCFQDFSQIYENHVHLFVQICSICLNID
jgi:hypothetical protein